MQRSLSGVGVIRHTLPLISAAALLAVVVVRRALGTRLVTTCATLGALLRVVVGAISVGGAGGRVWSQSPQGQIALFFGFQKPFLLAHTKEMVFRNYALKDAVLERVKGPALII